MVHLILFSIRSIPDPDQVVDEEEIKDGHGECGEQDQPDVEAAPAPVQAPIEVAAEVGAHLGLHPLPQLRQLLVSEAEGKGGDTGVQKDLALGPQTLHVGGDAAPRPLSSRLRHVVWVNERRPPQPGSGWAGRVHKTLRRRHSGHQASLCVLQQRHQLPGRRPR